VVQVAKIWAVDGGTGKDAGRNGGERAAGVGQRVGIGFVQGDNLIAAGGIIYHFERAADLV
jgi:hypothetical protein